MDNMLQNLTFEWLYSLTVIAIAAFLLFWGLYKLKKAEKSRLSTAKNMEVSEAIESDAPDEDSENITRRRAVSSIEARFYFIRRAFVPIIVLLAAFFVFVPLLPTLSASYVSLVAGTLAVLVGLASKPLVENAIAGIVITLSQPIRINDTVIIDGMYGTVEKINLLYTVVKVWNWRRYNIPNHKFLQKEFENLSQGDDQEWAHIPFYVAPGTDLERVKILAKQAMQCQYLLDLEPPSFWVMDLTKDAIQCWVAGWANNPPEAWALKSNTRKKLAESLRKEGISFQLVKSQVDINRDF